YLYSIHDIELIYNPINKDLIWMSNDLWIQRLFDNIFQNTLKHSKAKKLEITIENKVVSIKDNGIGFDMSRKSAGLGLKIIQDISRMLNVKYTLQSSKDGTIFCFTISENKKRK
ncbi:ATP-binding protein, partial [Bacillus pseudomycoides]